MLQNSLKNLKLNINLGRDKLTLKNATVCVLSLSAFYFSYKYFSNYFKNKNSQTENDNQDDQNTSNENQNNNQEDLNNTTNNKKKPVPGFKLKNTPFTNELYQTIYKNLKSKNTGGVLQQSTTNEIVV